MDIPVAMYEPTAGPSSGLPAFVAPDQPLPHSVPTQDNAAPTPSRTKKHPASTIAKRSCAACKARRVKCERPGDDDEVDCVGCLKRGWQCIPAEVKPRAKQRNGKRVKAIQEMLGEGRYVSSESPEAISTTALMVAPPSLSEQAVNVRLGSIELRESVMSNLLESFFTFRTISTFSNEVDFHVTFNRAGRRIDQLSDVNQILCGTLLAIGARCSDHPAILGPGALRIDELTEATKNDVDLTQYGRARENAYRKLAQQALTLADEKALFRQQSPESIAALMFLEGLNVSDRPVDPIFAKTCANQLRDLLVSAYSKPDVLGAIQNTTLAWTAVLRDALASAFNGSTFSFSDDDLWLLRGEQDPPPGLEDQLARPLHADPEVNYWTLMSSLVQHIIELCRETPSRLTGVRARKNASLDEEFAHEYLERCILGHAACAELRRRAKLVRGTQKFVRDAETLARTLSFSVINCTYILKDAIERRLDARPAGILRETDASLSPEDLSDYWHRLVKLQRDIHVVFFSCARETVALIKAVLEAGIPLGTHEWLDPRSIAVLFTRASLWAGAIVSAQTREEGGMPEYTIDDKLEDLRWIAKALRSIGWSSAKHAACLPWIEQTIADVEGQRAWFYPAGHAPVVDDGFALPDPPPIDSINLSFGTAHFAYLPESQSTTSPATSSTPSASGLTTPFGLELSGPDPSMDASTFLASLGTAFPSATNVPVTEGTDWNAPISDEALLAALNLPSSTGAFSGP